MKHILVNVFDVDRRTDRQTDRQTGTQKGVRVNNLLILPKVHKGETKVFVLFGRQAFHQFSFRVSHLVLHPCRLDVWCWCAQWIVCSLSLYWSSIWSYCGRTAVSKVKAVTVLVKLSLLQESGRILRLLSWQFCINWSC